MNTYELNVDIIVSQMRDEGIANQQVWEALTRLVDEDIIDDFTIGNITHYLED